MADPVRLLLRHASEVETVAQDAAPDEVADEEEIVLLQGRGLKSARDRRL